MKSKNKKQSLLCSLRIFYLRENVMMDTWDYVLFYYNETDFTMISYVFEAVDYEKDMIHVMTLTCS